MLKKLMITAVAVGMLAACGTPNPSGPGNKEPVNDKIKEDNQQEVPMEDNDMNDDIQNRDQMDNPKDMNDDNLNREQMDDQMNPEDETNNLGPDNENNPDRNTVR